MNSIKLLSIAAILVSVALVAVKLYKSDSWIVNPAATESMADSSAAHITTNDTEKNAVMDKDIAVDTFTARDGEQVSPIFWIKVFFSAVFCFAALYVVLSNKYNDETKKWAFSVLTLIAGVWIGTATK